MPTAALLQRVSLASLPPHHPALGEQRSSAHPHHHCGLAICCKECEPAFISTRHPSNASQNGGKDSISRCCTALVAGASPKFSCSSTAFCYQTASYNTPLGNPHRPQSPFIALSLGGRSHSAVHANTAPKCTGVEVSYRMQHAYHLSCKPYASQLKMGTLHHWC